MQQRLPAIYIMASRFNGTIYTGVTSDLVKRVYQHKNGKANSFAKKYNCYLLVYYEILSTMVDAIDREKKIKARSRKNKIELIARMNPDWSDLSCNLLNTSYPSF